MHKKVALTFQGRELTLETGKVANQASGAVWVKYGGTVVLVTAVADKSPGQPADFIPLTVNYQEKFYSSGKIPGGFFKREARPSDVETLASRLIDRPLRPLFPKNWFYETQIIPTVLSSDHESNPGVLALLGASAALEISHIPFEGPVAAVQVGRINGEWVVNPPYSRQEESDVDLIIAGNREGIIMVEGGAKFVPEEEILDGLFFGYESLKPLLEIQEELRKEAGKPKFELPPLQIPEDLESRVRELAQSELEQAWRIPEKVPRHDRLREIWSSVLEKLEESETDLGANNIYFNMLQDKLDKEILRKMIIEEGTRADGRKLDQVREITCEVGVLPRVHGSALFTRGETQALVTTTLGTKKDEKKIERLEDEYYKTFYLHYNFPPYSVGETRFRLGPGRREIGHGYLAERALARVLPSHEDFPYTIRVVSEITESNGSSSMASVCGGSMSLMDAGVPVASAVAGVAMGLVKESEGKFHVLTDIMGDEDHCGDMDFKIAGTKDGVTAIQMDIKISGLTKEIMQDALIKAREARLHILDKMNEVISQPRPDLSPYAPRIVTVKIPVDKIKDLIGPGGKIIRGIVEQTGAIIDVEDDGTVRVASPDAEVNAKAVKMIKELTAEPEVGEVYTGKVVRITDFGAFVQILPNTDGLLHISEIENRRIEKVTDVLREGDTVVVKCIRIDPDGKIALSRKAVLDLQPENARKAPEGSGPKPPPGTRPYGGPHDKGEARSQGRHSKPKNFKKKAKGHGR